MRKPLLAGNWKMNKTNEEALKLVRELAAQLGTPKNETLVCPPFISLDAVGRLIKENNYPLMLGAQTMSWEESGAFTGEISAPMIKASGATHVIIGHSERRQYFCETDETVNKKAKKALKSGLIPIIAVGETLEEREEGKMEEKVRSQILAALDGISDAGPSVFAYEPIWAIGTGKTATPEQANDVIRYIRALIGSRYNPETAQQARVIYGGSVTAENIDELMAEPDIDGALVGGASLDAASFARIVNFQS